MSEANYQELSRSVIITGGGTGIGRAAALAFAKAGDRVLIVGRSAGPLTETANQSDRIRALPLDITDPAAPERIVRTALDEFGRIDVLVHNAYTAGFGDLEALERASVEAQVATNLIAPIFLTQHAVSALAETGGTVVNITTSGSLGIRATPSRGVYGATKVALDSLTRTWAVELGPKGIRVVSVAPGLVDTGGAVRAGMMPEPVYQDFLNGMRSKVPAGRIGDPEDIAWWIVRITQPGAGYATGAVLAVDGGLSLT
jgi:C-7 ketoreductase